MAFMTVSAFWPRLPRAIGLPFALVGFVAMCTQIAFRLHDTNQARKDASKGLRTTVTARAGRRA